MISVAQDETARRAKETTMANETKITDWCPNAKSDVSVDLFEVSSTESVNEACARLGLRPLGRREPARAEDVVALVRERGVSGAKAWCVTAVRS
jgi:hypothetical protein